MGFQIDRIILRQIRMPLVHFFETSFGRTYERHMVLVEVVAGRLSGWGEVTAGENPFYNEEWTESAWLIVAGLRGAARAEAYIRRCVGSGATARRIFAGTTWRAAGWRRRCGIWKPGGTGVSLAKQIGGGARAEIACGVSIGIQDSVAQLIEEN